MQTFNYHTHSYRCGHAVGTEEEYIQAAIQGGFKTIGMSEHIPFPDWDIEGERLRWNQLDDWLDTMHSLREKYKDQIEIRIGFEVEYFFGCSDFYKEMAKKVDYMICGQHSYEKVRYHDYNYEPFYEDAYVEYMADQICAGVEEGLFKYVAHPDYFFLANVDWSPRKEEAIRRIAKCCKKHDVVIEINLKGMKYGMYDYYFGKSYRYPNHRTFEIVAEEGAKVVYGYDAHNPEALLHREQEDKAFDFLKDIPLVFEEDLKL